VVWAVPIPAHSKNANTADQCQSLNLNMTPPRVKKADGIVTPALHQSATTTGRKR
jgi:hypothetical protein